MKIKLNRYPYLCPVLEDNYGVKDGYYCFNESWYGVETDVELISESEDDRFWIVKIPTKYHEDDGTIVDGWLKCEIVKECFDLIEKDS